MKRDPTQFRPILSGWVNGMGYLDNLSYVEPWFRFLFFVGPSEFPRFFGLGFCFYVGLIFFDEFFGFVSHIGRERVSQTIVR